MTSAIVMHATGGPDVLQWEPVEVAGMQAHEVLLRHTAVGVNYHDAYVRSDLVALAPEITGRIIAVHIVDNQAVKKGDLLVTIDPVPFQLVVNQTKAQIEQMYVDDIPPTQWRLACQMIVRDEDILVEYPSK